VRDRSETSKTIACAIVGSRLDYANSVLTCISACNIHRLQRVQNSLARVVTRSTTNSTSALNLLHWLPIRQQIDYKLATIVHRSLHNACLQYLSSLLHAYTPKHVSFAPPPSIFSPRAKITLAFRGFRHTGPSIWNSLPPHPRSIDMPSNPISKQNSHVLFCKHFWPAPNNTILALLIHIYMLILAPKLVYITLRNLWA